MVINTITEKLVADTIAAEVYITSVVVIESKETITPESLSQETEVVISSGERGPPGINEEDMVYAKRVDFIDDNLIYKAEAAVGSSNSAAVWRIRKITLASDSDIAEKWANGNSSFNSVWDDRLALTYI